MEKITSGIVGNLDSIINGVMTGDDVSKFSDTLSKNINKISNANLACKDSDADMKKACKEFEAFFMGMIFRQMRESMIDDSSLFGNGTEQNMFWDLFSFEAGKHTAGDGIGISKMLYQQLKRNIDKFQTDNANNNRKD